MGACDVAVVRIRFGGQAARRSFTRAKDYLRRVAAVDLSWATVGVLAVAWLRFGNAVTRTCRALSLALPLLWLAALWPVGGFDVRFTGTGSDEFREVLNAGVSLVAAVAMFSYAINVELSRGYLLFTRSNTTLCRRLMAVRACVPGHLGAGPSGCRAIWAAGPGQRTRVGG